MGKYCRDITTERGRINCIAREIPCDCLEEKRIAAKLMEKVAVCYCCRKEFSKKMMLRCTGCNHVQYCSKECRIVAWSQHKNICRSDCRSMFGTSMPTVVAAVAVVVVVVVAAA